MLDFGFFSLKDWATHVKLYFLLIKCGEMLSKCYFKKIFGMFSVTVGNHLLGIFYFLVQF